jgi:putative ABC transport system permease protein
MMRDFRFAVRMLVKSPAFALIAVLAIALGIGGSTTMFSAINALLLRPMPLIQDQDRLLAVAQYFTKKPDLDAGNAYPDYLEFKKQATTLEGFAAIEESTMILSGGEKPERYLGAGIGADCFSFLGVQPILGRGFRADEDQPNAPPVVLIGYDVWKDHFGGDSGVVGRVVTLNGTQTTIIGVMPKGWRFPEVSDLWMPLQVDEKRHPRGNFYHDVIAKVKAGVSIEQARAELEQIAARLAAQYPETNTGVSIHA